MSMTQKQEIVVAASCADSQVWAWDITSGALVSTYRGPGNVYSGLCKVGNNHFATSQLQLSSASFGVVQFFEWHKPTPALKCFSEEPLTTLAATPSGNHIIGGSGLGRLFVWEVATGELLGSWTGHYKRVSALLTLEDGSIIVSGSDDGLVNVWSLISAVDPIQGQSGQGIAPLYSWAHHSLPITSLHAGFSSNGCNIVSASLDHTIKVWSTSMGRLLLSVEFPTALHSVLLDPSEVSIFAGGADGRIFRSKLTCPPAGMGDPLLSPNSPTSQMGEFTLVGHSRVVRMLACSNDCSLLVSGSDDCTIKIWDTMSRQLLRTLVLSKGPISCLMVLPMPVVLAHPELQQMMPPAKNVMPLQRRGGGGAGGKPAAAPWVTLPAQGPADVNHFYDRLVAQRESLQKDCLSVQAMLRVALDMEQKGSVAALEMDIDRLREDVQRAIANAEGWRKSHKELFELYTSQMGENPPKPRRGRGGDVGAGRARGGAGGGARKGGPGGAGLPPPGAPAGASGGGAGGVGGLGPQPSFSAREAEGLLNTGMGMPAGGSGMGFVGLVGQDGGLGGSGAQGLGLDVNIAGVGDDMGLGDDQALYSWKKGKGQVDLSFGGQEPNGMEDNFEFMHI